jgi:hypothetical protein
VGAHHLREALQARALADDELGRLVEEVRDPLLDIERAPATGAAQSALANLALVTLAYLELERALGVAGWAAQ